MKRKSWKRTAAFVTSLAMTTTMLPSDLSGFVTSIVHADATTLELAELEEGKIIEAGTMVNVRSSEDELDIYLPGSNSAIIIHGGATENFYVFEKCYKIDSVNVQSTNTGRNFYYINLSDASPLQELTEGSELPRTITAEAGETWEVTVLPGTIKLGENGTNTETLVCPRVTQITSEKIIVDEENFILFRDSASRDYKEGNVEGTNIYVASVDAENKKLTLTWKDPVQNDCLINFADNDVWTAVKSIVYGGENYYLKGLQGEYRKITAKTGEEVTVHSAKALNFNTTADVRYNEAKVRDPESRDEDLVEYVYTITVGRHPITVAVRNTQGITAANSNATVKTAPSAFDFNNIDGEEPTAVSVNDGVYAITPDSKYVVSSGDSDLAVYEDVNGNNALDAGDIRINKDRTSKTVSNETTYSYEFTAPYGNIFISRLDAHTHEFNWSVSSDNKTLIATCKKNGEENSHPTDFTYNYSLVKVEKDGKVTGEFKAIAPDSDADAKVALNAKFGFIKIRYSAFDSSTNEWGALSDTAPNSTAYGTYKVVADLYEDPNAYSPDDEEGDKHFELVYNVSPASGDSTNFPIDVTISFSSAMTETETIGSGENQKIVKKAHRTNSNGYYIDRDDLTISLNNGDYTIEGDVSSTTEGVKTLVVAGKGVYAGLYKELEWYCPGVNQYAVTSLRGSYVYGSPLKFDVSGFEGNKDKITYKAVSAQDAEIYRLWTALNDTQKNAVRVAYGTSFVEPTEPQVIDLAADTVLDVLTENTLYTNIKAKDASVKTAIEGALGITEGEVDALLGKYDVTAVYNGAPLAADKATVEVTTAGVMLDLEQREFTYDGTEKSFKLTATGIIPADSELLDALKNVEVKGLLKKTSIAPEVSTAVTAIKDAGDYRVVFNQEDVNSVLGDNYNIIASGNLKVVAATTGENPTPATYQVDARINPLNLDGFATATTATNLFVENNKYQKPVIVVKDAEGNDLSETGYYLSGTISAKKAGTYTTRIVGMGNYTGTLKVNWTVLGAQDFADTIELSPITATPMKLTDGRKVVKVSFTRTPVANKTAGYEVVDYGYVYANGDYSNTIINNLVLDKVDTTTIKKNSSKNPSNSFNGTYETKIVDANDKGVAARGYVTIKHVETGATYTVYTNNALTAETYDHLTATQLTEGFKLAYGDPLAAIVKSNGVDKNVVKVKLTREMAEESAKNGMSVAEYGFIFTNSTAPTAAEALTKFERMNYEDVDGTVVKKSSKTVTDGSANNGTFVLPIVDKGNGVRYRAYVILKNADGATFTVYANQKIENYNTEDIWNGYNTVLAENDNVTAVSSIQTADFATLKETQANRLVAVIDEKLSAENVYMDNGFGVNGEYYAAKFKTTRCLGQNISASDVTVLEYGFLYANEGGAPIAETEYIVANAKLDTNKTSKIKKITKTPKADDVLTIAGTPYNLVVKYLDNDNKATYKDNAVYNDIYARGYVTIKDNNTGIVSTVYGDLMKSEGFDRVGS